MKLLKRIIILGAFCISLCCSNLSFAIPVDKIIAFGDSLTDNGNIYTLSLEAKKVVPASPIIPNIPYYNGRFSNGLTWVENLAKILDVPLANYAYAGAWAEGFHESHILIPFDLRMQVHFYLAKGALDHHKDAHLYIIWIGANDYIKKRTNLEYATTNTVAKIKDGLESLIDYGARQIMVLNLPDIANTPLAKTKDVVYAQTVSELVKKHNQKLTQMIARLKESHPYVKFLEVDIASYYEEVRSAIEHGSDNYKGVRNVRDACYNGPLLYGMNFGVGDPEIKAAKISNFDIENTPDLQIALLTSRRVARHETIVCTKPDEYFFWDLVHPTRITHALLMEYVLRYLK